MTTGVRTIDLAPAQLLDEVLGHRNGSLVRQPLASLKAQLKDPGPIGGAIHAASEWGVVANTPADQTAGLHAALDAIPARGGTLLLPGGLIRANVVVRRSNVTIVGTGPSDPYSATGAAVLQGLTPYDPAKPALTVGDDTREASGIGLRNLSIVSEAGDALEGLLIGGGARHVSIDGIWINGFRKHCLRIENGDLSTYYVQIANYHLTLGRGPALHPDASTLLVRYNPKADPASAAHRFTTAIMLVNGTISKRTSGGWAITLDGAELRLLNAWIEAAVSSGQAHGINLLRSSAWAQSPRVFADGVAVDGRTGIDTVLKVHTTSLNVGDVMIGNFTLDGCIENSAGTKVPQTGQYGYHLYPALTYPRVNGRLSFPDFAADPADESARVSAFGTAGARALSLTGDRVFLMAGAGGAFVNVAGANALECYPGVIQPGADNSTSLGTAARRLGQIYSSNSTILTSDGRDKQDIETIPDEWLDAWAEVRHVRFRWRSAVGAKGARARWHTGLVAQEVRDRFAERGIDPFAIGLLCFDQWEPSEPGDALDGAEAPGDEGAEPPRAPCAGTGAGDRYGLRYEEAEILEAAWSRREHARLRREIAELREQLAPRLPPA